jgi:hypothetical protein
MKSDETKAESEKKRIKLSKKTVKHLSVNTGVVAGAAGAGSYYSCSDIVLKRRIRRVR